MTLGLYFPVICSLEYLESTMISASFIQKLLNVRLCNFPFFSSVCLTFTDYSIAGHNILPASTSTVSCRGQTLRQIENKC